MIASPSLGAPGEHAARNSGRPVLHLAVMRRPYKKMHRFKQQVTGESSES